MSIGYEAIENASLDELRSVQFDRLKSTLQSSYDNVDHYRHSFDRAGVHPNDLTTLDDLASFPLLTKEDLRQNYPFGMFAVPRSEVLRLHASSAFAFFKIFFYVSRTVSACFL